MIVILAHVFEGGSSTCGNRCFLRSRVDVMSSEEATTLVLGEVMSKTSLGVATLLLVGVAVKDDRRGSRKCGQSWRIVVVVGADVA